MSRPVLLVVLLLAAGCGCNQQGLAGRFGELAVVRQDTVGREFLLRDATVPLPRVAMGQVGTSQVPVRNIGLEPVTVVRVTRLDGDEALSLDDAVGVSVAGLADGALPTRFSPPQAADATLPEAPFRARFSLALEGTRPEEAELLVELQATAVARDCFLPAELDFGDVPLQQAVMLPVRLDNARELPATAARGAVEGDDAAFFTVEAAPSVTVAPGGAAAFPVRFSPLEERPYAAAVTMQRAEDCPMARVQLRGAGRADAIAWQPTTVEFGRLPLGETATREVTLVNGSAAELALSVSTAGAGFGVSGQPPRWVPPRSSVTVQVTCTPEQLGPFTGHLTLEVGTEPPLPGRVALRCVGGGPRIRVDPNPLQFGLVPWSAGATPQSSSAVRRRLVVQNVGTAPPAPGDPSHNLVLGRDGGLPWFSIVPGNVQTRAEEFSVALRTPMPVDGLPAVAGQNLVEFDVIVAATTAAAKSATLLVYSNDAKEPVVRVPLSAQPRNSEPCVLDITPEGVDFGATPRGAVATRRVTLANRGAPGTLCLVSGIEMGPGSSPVFLVTEPLTASLLIEGGQSREVRVSATVPLAATVGEFLQGKLRLSVAGEATPRELPVDLLVSRCLVADPPLLEFGAVREGCVSAGKPLTLYNLCSVPVTVDELAVPSPFRLTSTPSQPPYLVLPGQKATSTLAFAAPQAGTWAEAAQVSYREVSQPYTAAVALRASADDAGVQTDEWVQSGGEVDILFVVDDSCSMANKQQALATNLASFINSTTGSNSDWRIGVTTTDMFTVKGRLLATATNPAVLTPATPSVTSLFAAKVNVGTNGSGFEQAYAAMAAAVTEPNRSGANAGFLRANAALAVVIVTDAAEQSPGTPGSYLTTLAQAKGNRADLVNVSVVGPFTATPGCIIDGPPDSGRFEQLVQATGGVKAEICSADWAANLETISQSVFGARKTFTLTGQPDTSRPIIVTVNGVTRNAGWRYDAARNALIFTTVPPPGATVRVTYTNACY